MIAIVAALTSAVLAAESCPGASQVLGLHLDRAFSAALLVPAEAKRYDYPGIDSEIKKWKSPALLVEYDFGNGAGRGGGSAPDARACVAKTRSGDALVTTWTESGRTYVNGFWRHIAEENNLSVTYSSAGADAVDSIALASIESVISINDPQKLILVAARPHDGIGFAVLRDETGESVSVERGECFAGLLGCLHEVADAYIDVRQSRLDQSGVWKVSTTRIWLDGHREVLK